MWRASGAFGPHRAVSRAAGVALVAMAMAMAAQPAAAQWQQQLFVSPTAPLAPTDSKQCTDLDAQWQLIRQDVDRRHSECLTAQSKANGRSENSGECTYAACRPFHGAWRLGTDVVQRCRDQVRDYKAEVRAREEAARKAEEEQRRREADERERASAARERQDRERQAADRREADRQTAAREAERQRARQAEADRKAIESALSARQAQQQALEAANRQRDEQARQLAERQSQANDKVGDLASKAERQALSAGEAIARAARGLLGAPAQSGGDAPFDLSGKTDDSFASTITALTTAGGVAVPWAGVQFSIIANSANATGDVIDALGRTIADFDHSDGRELAAAFDAFPQRVFGLQPVLRAIAENAIGGLASAGLKSAVWDPAIEAGAVRMRLAIDEGRPSALFKTPPPPAGPSARVFHWWEGRSAAEATMLRDDRGTPLLFDRSGRPVRFDASRNRAAYDLDELERIVARTDALPRWVRPLTWTERQSIFVPSTEGLGEKPYESILQDWIVGAFVATQTSKAFDAMGNAMGGKKP